jgi:hypothetical protein
MLSQLRQDLAGSYAVLGTHLQSPDDPFEMGLVRLDALGEWIGKTGIRYEPPRWDTQPGVVAARAEYVASEQPVVTLVDGTKVRLQIGPGLKASRYEVTLRQDTAVEFRPAQPKSCDEMADYVRGFREFLALVTDYPASVTEAHLLLPGSAPTSERLVGWLARWQGPMAGDRNEISWHRMLFNLRDAAEYWAPLVQGWYEKRPELADCLDLLLSVTYAPPTFLDTEFLLTVQSAEAYHRRNVRNLRWPKDEFKRWKDGIVQACPAQDRERVEQLLRFANEPTLRERLKDLYDQSAKALPMLFDRFPNWVDQTTDMRNTYTHRGTEKGPTFDRVDVFTMAEVTSFVVKACVLLSLGVPDRQLADHLLNNSRYSMLLSRGFRALQVP